MKTKRILAVLLSLCLLLGMVSLSAFAGEEQTRYLVLGDSIAYGSGLSNSREAVYGKIVADTNGYAYDNYAVPGHTTDALLRRMEQPAVKDAIQNADIISISIGGNNFLLGNILGLLYDGIVKEDFKRFDSIADGFYDDLGTIVGTIRESNPDAAILLQTIYNPQTGYVGDVYQAGGDRINAKIRAFAAANPGEIIVVDVAAALTDSDTDFAADRIHPSTIGNEKIAKVVLQTLKENGLGEKTEPVINTKGQDIHLPGAYTRVVDFAGSAMHALSVVRNFFLGLFR